MAARTSPAGRLPAGLPGGVTMARQDSFRRRARDQPTTNPKNPVAWRHHQCMTDPPSLRTTAAPPYRDYLTDGA